MATPTEPMSRPEEKQTADRNIALRGPLRSIHLPPKAAASPSITMAMLKTIAIAVSLVSNFATSGVLKTLSA